MHPLIDRCLEFQRRHAWSFVLVAIILSVFTARPAIKLLSTVATDIIHLLPESYPSVHYSNLIKEKFNKRSSLFLIIDSPDAQTTQQAALHALAEIQKLEDVDFVISEKTGYDFIDKNMLMLVDLEDLYKTRDALKEKIQKTKLGGLYIDFEEDTSNSAPGFDKALSRYRQQYMNGINTRYTTNADGTVFTLSIYPKSSDSSLGFFKNFGQRIEVFVETLKLKERFGSDVNWGYAGAIKTRVDEYSVLMSDLKLAGLISLAAIFIALYIYFRRVVAVVLVFAPMVMSTFWGFAFNSLFFQRLNIVTAFLFSIIFGLGVDIGIHLLTRYMQERKAGLSIRQVYYNIYTRTGMTCATSVLTTVASFYVLVFFDFKGFSDFGWIAGNGLIIALLTYLIFMPPLILLADRYHLLRLPRSFGEEGRVEVKHPHKLSWARPVMVGIIWVTAVLVGGQLFSSKVRPQFEYNFNTLKMQLPERILWKKKLRDTTGRVNSPAYYLIESEVEARKLKSILNERRRYDDKTPTIEFFGSYYDLIPRDHAERLSVLHEIEDLLADDALNSLSQEDRDIIADLRASLKELAPISEKDIPQDMRESFWGNTGKHDTSVALVAPLPVLELDDGVNAQNFFADVHELSAFGKKYYAISDSIVFADMLNTMFRDSRFAIAMSLGLLIFLIALHLRDFRRTSYVVFALGCGMTWMLGLMGIFGFKLNFYNMVVLPTIIGMGEDNSVHIIDRYEEFGRKSILAVLKTSGGAAFMASLTTILGYGGLLFTHHPGLKSIGMMSMIGMGTCLLSSLVLLPMMLHVLHRPSSNCTLQANP